MAKKTSKNPSKFYYCKTGQKMTNNPLKFYFWVKTIPLNLFWVLHFYSLFDVKVYISTFPTSITSSGMNDIFGPQWSFRIRKSSLEPSWHRWGLMSSEARFFQKQQFSDPKFWKFQNRFFLDGILDPLMWMSL